jgi:hypothetical protein
MTATVRPPRHRRHFRFQWEPAQGCHVLLYPEGMVKLNQSAGEILKRCDGARTRAGHRGRPGGRLQRQRPAPRKSRPSWRWPTPRTGSPGTPTDDTLLVPPEALRSAAPAPLWLLAEVTYRCPLHCVFCYNPVDFAQAGPELSTDEWLKVLREARALGAVQCGFSGGEPLLRDDLELLVRRSPPLGFYTNLHHLRRGPHRSAPRRLKDAGLDHIQLSFQDATREANDFLTNTRTFDLKRKVAAMTKAPATRW